MTGYDARAQARTEEVRLWPLVGRQMAVLALVALVLWALRERVPALDLSSAWQMLQQIRPAQWLLAAVATAASFWAVGRYDELVHGLLGTNIGPRSARRSGTASIAIAQLAGFGVLSGALVRWRLLPDLGLGSALRVSLAVSLSFLAAWAVVCSVAILASGIALQDARPVAAAVLFTAIVAGLFLLVRPDGSRRWPTPGAGIKLIALSLLDTSMAALALHVLLPAEIAIPPGLFFTAFLAALGAGLIGGTPGGIGPFEVTLLGLLPTVPGDALLASVLGFRLVYYVLPAGLGLALLLRGSLAPEQESLAELSAPERSAFLPPKTEALVWSAPFAEANLLRHGEFSALRANGEAIALAAPVGQSLAMLGDALAKHPGAEAQALHALRDCAGRQQRTPLLYKCPARMAVAARQIGWVPLRIADEAWIDPRHFHTRGPEHRQLRRLLRKAERAQVTVIEGGSRLPLDEMQAVASQWAQQHGGERGFTMGRFGRDHVNCQRVFLAYRNGRLVAFVTFHETRQEWTLDLMRHGADTPDGTMHLLVIHAIRSAAAMRCARLSLAAVIHQGPQGGRLLSVLRDRIAARSGAAGLRRFKTSFAPGWRPLYAAAPGRAGLMLGLLAILRRIDRG